MLISIVIPLFNKEKYIHRAINSVLKQTYRNFELIIIDDGSTDGSANIAKSLSDERIHYHFQNNGGVSKARNTGVRLANSLWVAFLDADDEYEPDFLNRIVLFINEHKQNDLSMVGANYYIGSRANIAVGPMVESGIHDYFKLFQDNKSPNHSSTTVVNKNKILKVSGFPEGVKQFEDWITWFKLAFVGEFGFISSPLGVYHYVNNAATKSKRSPAGYYSDAKMVSATLSEYVAKYPVLPDTESNLWRRHNEIVTNAARRLAHDGGKKYALNMLLLVQIKYTSKKLLFDNLKYILLHLLIPQKMKQIYWTYKRC